MLFRSYYKDSTNAWQQVGSPAWARAFPVVNSTTSTINLPAGSEFVLNGTVVTLTTNITSMASLVTEINAASVAGVTAAVVGGRLAISATTSATNGSATGVCEVSPSSVSTTPINAGSFVSGRTYKIASVGTTNFAAIGASANTVGTVFTATGVGSGTGTASDVAVCVLTPSGTLTNGQMNIGFEIGGGLIYASRLTNKYIWDGSTPPNRYAANFFAPEGVAAAVGDQPAPDGCWSALLCPLR